MAGRNDGSLLYDTKVNTNGFKKSLLEMKKDALKDSADIVSSFNKTAKAIALGAASVGAGIVAVGVKYNSQMEQYNAGFTTMLGSAEKAQKLMNDLKGFASKTPFEMTDLANASTTLLAFGEDVNQLMPDLKMLGDISLGNAEKFKGLALVFGQVQSQGRLMGQDLLQMINQGFNPLQIISEKTGKSVATLKDEMAKGQITFAMVADAMKTATSEGGQFYNAMETQSKTLSGQWSTLKDNVTALTGEMAEDISEKLTTSVLPDLIDKVEKLNEMWEDGSLQDYIGTAVSALAAFGAGVAALNLVLFANDLMQVKNGVEGFTTATKAGAAAQKLMNAELLKNPYVLAAAALATLVAGMVAYSLTHETAAETVIKSVREISKAHTEAIAAIEKKEQNEKAAAEVSRTYKEELFNLEKQLKSGTLTQEEATAVAENFKIVASKLEEIIPGITDYLFDETGEINLQKEAVDKLCDAYYNLVVAKATASAAEEKISEIAKTVIEQKKNKKDAEQIIKEKTPLYEALIPNANTNVAEVRNNASQAMALQNEITIAQKAANKADEEIKNLTQEQTGYLEILKETETEIKKLTNAETKLGDKVDDDAGKIKNSITSTAKQTTEETKKEFENKYKVLKRALEREQITHADYYKILEELRNTYFKEGSDGWDKYTEELQEFTEDTFDDCLDRLDDFKNESLSKIDELKKEQESLKESMMPDKAPIEWGTIDGEAFVSLANYDKELNQMQRYGNMLDELLTKRGELPQSVLDELKNMDTEQAMKYVEALLNSSDVQFNAYLEAQKKLEEAASANSTKLMSTEVEEMKRILEEKFGELPEDFFNLGDESASSFGNGFIRELNNVMQIVRDSIMAEMSSISGMVSVNSANAIGSANNITTTNNAYTNNYTFNSSKQTTTEQINAARAASTLDRLRNG